MTTFLIILGILVVLLLLASLAIGKEMNIEKIITVDKPLEQVFDYVQYVKNQDNFSKWNMTDPQMKKEYRGTDAQVGFVYRWDSSTHKNVGAGEQEITAIDPGKKIDYELRFERPMKNVARSAFVFTPLGAAQTQVQWGFYSRMVFPMNILKSVFTKMLGKDLSTSLENLKLILEKK